MLGADTVGGYLRTRTYVAVDEADRQKLRREITESRYPSRTSPRGQRVDGDAVAAQIPALGMMLARLFQKRCAFMGDEKIVHVGGVILLVGEDVLEQDRKSTRLNSSH